MEIADYLSRARIRAGLQSERQLCLALDLSKAALSHWRKGRALPSPRTLMQVADLAGVPRDEAMRDLATWRGSRLTQPADQDVVEPPVNGSASTTTPCADRPRTNGAQGAMDEAGTPHYAQMSQRPIDR